MLEHPTTTDKHSFLSSLACFNRTSLFATLEFINFEGQTRLIMSPAATRFPQAKKLMQSLQLSIEQDTSSEQVQEQEFITSQLQNCEIVLTLGHTSVR